MKVHTSHHTSLQEFEVISAIQLGISRQDRWAKQLPKILASWLFSSLGKKFLNQLKEDGRKREKKKKISFFLCLSYFVLTLAEVVALHTRASYSWKLLRKTRGTEKAVVSPSFPATAPSRPQITQVLAYLHLVFATSPLSVSLKQTTGTQARLTLESKAFYHLRPPLFILSLAGDKLTALTQGQICLKGPVYWEWRISPFSKFSQKPITALHTI